MATYPIKPQIPWVSEDHAFSVRPSPNGAIRYRENLVDELPHIPLLISIDKPYASLNQLVNAAAHKTLLRRCCNYIARYGIKDCVDVQSHIVQAFSPLWHDGHVLLEQLATRSNPYPETSWPQELTAKVFGHKFFARSLPTHPLLDFRISRIEHRWRQEGKQPLPWYFAGFGLMSAARKIQKHQAEASQKAARIRGRQPAQSESQALDILNEALERLDPDLLQLIRFSRITYRIARTRIIAGTLQTADLPRRTKLYLSERLFSFSFARALSIFVHEHSHFLGSDGQREFTDQLTWLFESVIEHRNELNDLETRWREITGTDHSVVSLKISLSAAHRA